jgi:CubicO group peptidase (beta-lactamase class C family)
MPELEDAVDSVADAEGFSGVVRVDRADAVELAKAYGFAHRAYELENALDTQFALASGTKGLTALAVVSLIEDGSLALSTTARSVLGSDLPLIGGDVTIEHLLSHRSGIEYVERCLADRAAARRRYVRLVKRSKSAGTGAVPGGNSTPMRSCM